MSTQRTLCPQCKKPEPSFWCWMGDPGDTTSMFYQPGDRPCPLGKPPRWKVDQ